MIQHENEQFSLRLYKGDGEHMVWDPRKENSKEYEHEENRYGYMLTKEPVYSAEMTLKSFAFRDGDCRERYPEELKWDVEIPADVDSEDVEKIAPEIAKKFLENYQKGDSINVAFMMAHAEAYGEFAKQNWLEMGSDERDL